MKEIKGDLLEYGKNGTFDVIIHGCNCQNSMGAGIAKSIRQEFPEAYEADKLTKKGDKRKLGNYSSASIDFGVHELIVVNAYTQFYYGRGKVHADYEAIRKVFSLVKENFSGLKIGYPLIGAGLAGGDWKIISKIIEEELEGEDHTLVLFTP